MTTHNAEDIKENVGKTSLPISESQKVLFTCTGLRVVKKLVSCVAVAHGARRQSNALICALEITTQVYVYKRKGVHFISKAHKHGSLQILFSYITSLISMGKTNLFGIIRILCLQLRYHQ